MPGLFDQEDYDNLTIQTYNRLKGFKAYDFIHDESKAAYETLAEIAKVDEKKYDFVFIDGIHKYDTIKWECNHYQNLVKVGGCLMGHDYDIFEDVNKAVEEFANEQQKKLQLLKGNIWYIEY